MHLILIWLIGAIVYSAWTSRRIIEADAFDYIIGFFIGLFWPVIVAARFIRWVINSEAKKWPKK